MARLLYIRALAGPFAGGVADVAIRSSCIPFRDVFSADLPAGRQTPVAHLLSDHAFRGSAIEVLRRTGMHQCPPLPGASYWTRQIGLSVSLRKRYSQLSADPLVQLTTVDVPVVVRDSSCARQVHALNLAAIDGGVQETASCAPASCGYHGAASPALLLDLQVAYHQLIPQDQPLPADQPLHRRQTIGSHLFAAACFISCSHSIPVSGSPPSPFAVRRRPLSCWTCTFDDG